MSVSSCDEARQSGKAHFQHMQFGRQQATRMLWLCGLRPTCKDSVQEEPVTGMKLLLSEEAFGALKRLQACGPAEGMQNKGRRLCKSKVWGMLRNVEDVQASQGCSAGGCRGFLRVHVGL